MATASKAPTLADLTAVEQERAQAALLKKQGGEEPTSRENDALKKYQAAVEETRRLDYYRTVPKRHYQELSGRSAQVLNEQADRYDLPLRGATLDLFTVLKAFHDFLAANRLRLKQAEASAIDWREKEREEAYQLKRMDRLERQGQLMPADEVRDGHKLIVAQLRRLGDQLEQHFGPEAREMLNDTMEVIEREITAIDGDS